MNDLDWQLEKNNIKSFFYSQFVGEKLNLISSEAVCNTSHTFRNLNRIKEIFGDCKILYINRALHEVRRSHYLYDIFHENVTSFYTDYFDDTKRPLALGKCSSENLYEAGSDFIRRSCRFLGLNLTIKNFNEMITETTELGYLSIDGIQLECLSSVAENSSLPINEVVQKFVKNIENRYQIGLSHSQKKSLESRFLSELPNA